MLNDFSQPGTLARISHKPPTAAAQWPALAGFRSFGVLNVLSSTLARSSVTQTSQVTPLSRLATDACEKYGLVRIRDYAHAHRPRL